MRKFFQFIKTFNREAALDSLRNVLAVIGLGVILGDFFTMRWYFVFPGIAFFLVTWYADYMRHDLSGRVIYSNDDPILLGQIAELGR